MGSFGTSTGGRRPLRLFVAGALALTTAFSGTAFADFEDALRAYARHPSGQIDQTKVLEALDLWTKHAIAGDVRSRQILGDIFTNSPLFLVGGGEEAPTFSPVETGVITKDLERALAWYTIAATHDFSAYRQQPDFAQINARAYARDRLPILRAEMSTEQVKEAESLIVEILSSGSAFDLYRLGTMYQQGTGLPKSNVEALKFYRLATNRARNANPLALKAADSIRELMTPDEIETALKLEGEWEPPLPEAFSRPSPMLTDLEQKTRVLQQRRLALAIEEIEREFSGNDDIVQNALAALGLYLGPIDGDVGPQTRKAIERFQYNLVEDKDSLTPEQKRDGMTGVLTPPQKVALIAAAAGVNHPQSQYIYGVMHAEGIGVPVNGEVAVTWLKKSASFGYPLAHYALGQYYREGIYGDDPVDPSRSEAAHHFGQAIGLGYAPAQKALNELYEITYEPTSHE
ncbi:hypothetical protein PB2503_09999 [Parvularcula bermudensis HTCC2503]|uniref:Peptidoglycan binding-like domain-containing protein n=1 Tax=Parvularcula bermudensis (strain ATCC BAA-594 / HTCC2503 / KCTC 12087) TaxID=314260 RepID=E0TEV9_PARBH|nr:peptidoglycan-binding protein [Parvularcula bermudensis]ADM10052.1 hypothetical protein PB2503_09999 [Parvularcula bermudensis HTCC2503]